MASRLESDRIDEYLNKLKLGQRSALAPLYDATAKKIYALCFTYMRNQHDSEDALSEVYLSVVRSIDKYRGSSGFNWIYTIAKNICLNMLRSKGRTQSVDFNDEEAVNTLGLGEESEPACFDESGIIALSARELDEKEFRIVILHAINGMKFKEIAHLLGGPETTVRWQYNNAIKKVRNAYERRTST